MNHFDVLARALLYIEDNIGDSLDMREIARNAYCSLSSLQKLFRFTFDYSVKEYIAKRRLTLAAQKIIQSDRDMIDIALMYGYNSPENFSRAFKKMWSVNPSEYRNRHQYVELFPMLSVEKHGTDSYDFHKDVTALYDYLIESPNVKIICFDIVGLMRINEISRDAGDKAILEAVKRISSLKEDSQLLFRLGGDEFALLIRDKDLTYCSEIDEKINSMNGKCFEFCGQEIPLVIRVWISTNTVFESKHEMSEELIHNVKYAWEQIE